MSKQSISQADLLESILRLAAQTAAMNIMQSAYSIVIGANSNYFSIRLIGRSIIESKELVDKADSVLIIVFDSKGGRSENHYIRGEKVSSSEGLDIAPMGVLLRFTWDQPLGKGRTLNKDTAALLIAAVSIMQVQPKVYFNGDSLSLPKPRVYDSDTLAEKDSKRLAYLLRHDIRYNYLTAYDKDGWRTVKDLETKHGFSYAELLELTVRDEKQRFEVSPCFTLIRARYGHSFHTIIHNEFAIPPDTLFHGTAEKYWASIQTEGIKGGKRQYVHLTTDRIQARVFGQRHGNPIVLTVDAKRMYAAGFSFYKATDYIWQTKYVPLEYIGIVDYTREST